MEKYFVFWGAPGWTGFEIRETHDHDQMTEWVREHHKLYEFLPTVYFGQKLEFEPAEIVKSWKIKERLR